MASVVGGGALVESLPLWPLMETTVTPLTTFDFMVKNPLPISHQLLTIDY